MTMHFIQGYTTTGSSAGFYDFSNIPQTFTHLQLRYTARDTGSFTTRGLFLEVNGNTQGNINSEHYIKGDGSTATSQAYTGLGRFDWGEIPAASGTANTFGGGIVDILDYSNTNKTKTFKIMHGYDLNGSGQINMWSGLWNSTNAITTFRIYPNNAFVVGSTLQLYGVTSNQVATGV